MITALTMRHVRLAYQELEQRYGWDLEFDEAPYSSLLKTHSTLIRSMGGADRPEALVTIASGMLCGAAGYLVHGSPYDQVLAFRLLEMFLGANHHLLVSAERERFAIEKIIDSLHPLPEPPSDAVLDAVRHWVGACSFSPDGTTINEQLGLAAAPDPVRCFIACPMSNPSPLELDFVAEVSDQIASVLSAAAIACYQPIQHTDPRRVPGLAHSHVVREIDEREIARSDLVMLICSLPATGIGVVAALAERYGAITVVISDRDRVSPMVTGAQPEPEIMHLDTNLPANIVDFLDEHGEALVRRSRRRSQRMIALAARLGEYRLRLATLTDDELTAEVNLTLDRERFRQLLAWEGFLLGASLDEVEQLEGVLGLRLPTPTMDQERALFAAEFEHGWPPEETEAVAMSGRRELLDVGKRRWQLTNPEDWVRIHNRLFGHGTA